jgi:hypothetical protein
MLEELELFYRDIAPSRATVYVRAPLPDRNHAWQLAGRVRGPFTARGHTLPSNASLEDLGGGDSLLARASVIDPCTWSPEAPNLYDVAIELLRDGMPHSKLTRRIGLRDLRPQRSDLLLDAKRIVLRGMECDHDQSPAAWRDASAVRVLNRIDDPWLEQADSQGVFTIVRLDELDVIDAPLLRQVARHACVALVVLSATSRLPENVRLVAPNLLLAQRLADKEPIAKEPVAKEPVAPWAHVAWIEANDRLRFARLARGVSLPIVAVKTGSFPSLSEARQACDSLQAELASAGQFAGYIVRCA